MISTLMWVLSGILATIFLMAGAMKGFQIEKAAAKMSWVDKFGRDKAKMVGYAEILGALGLILPIALDFVTILSGIAAIGLAALMAGAVVKHIQWDEEKSAPIPASLGIASAVLTYLHFA